MKKFSAKSIGMIAASAALVAVSGGVALTAAHPSQPANTAKRTSAPKRTSGIYTKPLVIGGSVSGNIQDNFSPFQGSADLGTYGIIYQPLFYFDNISGHTFGFLGQSYKWSNGNKTLTVNLRKNVKWSDGKPFSSADVVFTYDLLKKYPALDLNGVWTQLSSVTAHGPDQVVFQFKHVDVPYITYVLGVYIVPQHIWAKLGNPTTVTVTHPVGTGPYELSSFNPQVYYMKANPYYYLGNPKVKTLEITSYTGNTSADLALAKGQIDWGGSFIPGIQKVYASKSPYNKYWFPPTGITTLYPNLKDPLLGNLAVRQAISMAINRQIIYKEGEYGYEPPANPAGLILPNDANWLDPALKNTKYSYNPAAAVKILEKAGFKKNAQGIFQSPSGKPLSFTIQVVTGWTDWDMDCQLIANELKQVGINVQVQEEQYGTYYANLKAHKFQLAVSWVGTGPTPYYTFQQMLAPNGGWNIEQWSNPATTNALNKFALTTNAAQQKRDLYVLENAMVKQLPTIPLVYGANWYEYNTRNVAGWPTPQNPYVNPATFAGPATAIVLMHLHAAN